MDTTMTEIKSKLKKIFLDRLSLDIDRYDEDILEHKLLGKTFNLSPMHLLYLYNDVESMFGITISQQHVTEERFNSFKDICDVIYEEMSLKTRNEAV